MTHEQSLNFWLLMDDGYEFSPRTHVIPAQAGIHAFIGGGSALGTASQQRFDPIHQRTQGWALDGGDEDRLRVDKCQGLAGFV